MFLICFLILFKLFFILFFCFFCENFSLVSQIVKEKTLKVVIDFDQVVFNCNLFENSVFLCFFLFFIQFLSHLICSLFLSKIVEPLIWHCFSLSLSLFLRWIFDSIFCNKFAFWHFIWIRFFRADNYQLKTSFGYFGRIHIALAIVRIDSRCNTITMTQTDFLFNRSIDNYNVPGHVSASLFQPLITHILWRSFLFLLVHFFERTLNTNSTIELFGRHPVCPGPDHSSSGVDHLLIRSINRLTQFRFTLILIFCIYFRWFDFLIEKILRSCLHFWFTLPQQPK